MIDPSLIKRYNYPVPRYTSYPPATAWTKIGEAPFLQALSARNSLLPLSLYLHIPFCRSVCHYCGCSTIQNTSSALEEQYVEALLKEIALVHAAIGQASVNQIHFGGGTPTTLSCEQLTRLVEAIKKAFSVEKNAELAIEIDPRTVVGNRTQILYTLKSIGFNRISLGIQDFAFAVQKAIGRGQSEELSTAVFRKCQEVGFESINVDLIYGLPCQTVSSFKETIDRVIELRPHRIAIFSFAYLPDLKQNQKAIYHSQLPSPDEKFQIYYTAKEKLVTNGYTAIGLDHFALAKDALAMSLEQGSLRRTFQGYTVLEGRDVIGLGLTGISELSSTPESGFFQHTKTLSEYFDTINKGVFPIVRGIILSPDDKRRQFVIEQLMCQGKICKKEFENHWKQSFDEYFVSSIMQLEPLLHDGLVSSSAQAIEATPLGTLFLRNIASCFDAYCNPSTPGSNAI